MTSYKGLFNESQDLVAKLHQEIKELKKPTAFEDQMWSVKEMTADTTPRVCEAALALAKELLEMDAQGAIELNTWPKARELIRSVLE
tara:strand:+ start:360 stop:620 length:261 start_codon:yes stop_codon:yes gene_type:complete